MPLKRIPDTCGDWLVYLVGTQPKHCVDGLKPTFPLLTQAMLCVLCST